MQQGSKILGFDLFADYGQLKKYYTTMSPLSFSIPSGTVLRGILGAIIGIDKEENPEYFHGVKMALCLRAPVKKVVIPENLLKTVSKRHFSRYEQHKPTNIEFVKDARFRLYLQSDDEEIYRQLKQHLFAHTSVYTISLGISEALANFDSVEETQIAKTDSDSRTIHSIIPVDQINNHDIDFGELELFTVQLPMKMKNDREVIEYREFLFERRGEAVTGSVSNLCELENGHHVLFF